MLRVGLRVTVVDYAVRLLMHGGARHYVAVDSGAIGTSSMMVWLRAPAFGLHTTIGGAMTEMAAVPTLAVATAGEMHAFRLPTINRVGSFTKHVLNTHHSGRRRRRAHVTEVGRLHPVHAGCSKVIVKLLLLLLLLMMLLMLLLDVVRVELVLLEDRVLRLRLMH